MHFKNKKAIGHPAYRKSSSDWRFPQIEHGSSQRGHHSVALRAASANDQLQEVPEVAVVTEAKKPSKKPTLTRAQLRELRIAKLKRDISSYESYVSMYGWYRNPELYTLRYQRHLDKLKEKLRKATKE